MARTGTVAPTVEAVGSLPAWLSAALDAAEADAGPGRLPVVAVEVARPGGLRPKRLVVVPADWLDDWRRREG